MHIYIYTYTHTYICTYLYTHTHIYICTYTGFLCGSFGKESTCNVGDLGSIPGLGRFPGEGKGYQLHYSGLEIFMDYIGHGIAKSQTQLSNFHFIYNIYIYAYAMLCYAKSLQSCPTLCDPIDGSPPGSPVPGILQARTLEWVAISFFNA